MLSYENISVSIMLIKYLDSKHLWGPEILYSTRLMHANESPGHLVKRQILNQYFLERGWILCSSNQLSGDAMLLLVQGSHFE